jgi:hypothetical protein
MKLAGVIGTAILSLTLGASSAAYAQDQHPEQQEEQKDKPAEKKVQPEKQAKPEEKNAQEEKNTKPEEKNAQQRAPEAKPAEHATAGRIPADRYKANFGGYWFGFGGAWPSNWLYTQDVYVVEIDGMYYLCNPMYPGVNLVINVTL